MAPIARIALTVAVAVGSTVATRSTVTTTVVQPTFQGTPSAPSRRATVEHGSFRLYKFQQAVGEERYEITRDGASVVLQSTFEFADRGVKVPISATLRLSADLRPESFLIRGKTSRFSEIDRELHITGRTATVREQEQTRQVTAPDRFFTIGGYAPVPVQMLLVRYLRRHAVNAGSSLSVCAEGSRGSPCGHQRHIRDGRGVRSPGS
jgi:hypothetical protein